MLAMLTFIPPHLYTHPPGTNNPYTAANIRYTRRDDQLTVAPPYSPPAQHSNILGL